MRIITKENISRCCFSCNASKGSKLLKDWLKSDYCHRKGINEKTVAPVVKDALLNPPSISTRDSIRSDSIKLKKEITKYLQAHKVPFENDLIEIIKHLESKI